MLNIARKELQSMFASPMGWIILAVIAAMFGNYFANGVTDYLDVASGAIRPAERFGITQSVSQSVYGSASFIMLFAVPLLSMRLIAEERRSQTLPFLFSSPLSITDIVVGKFLGLMIFLSSLILYIGLMLSTLNLWSDIDFGYIIANTLGLLLLTGSFCALGIYFSSLTSQPIIAGILSFIVSFILMILGRFFANDPTNVAGQFSFSTHFQSFANGLLDTADLAFFILFIITFLTLTIRRLDADRLRG
ncbi:MULTISPECIES: ABC transporter permease [unclassified Methylophilus]|jgi:ABC-2 type transport system permease protein|uniref:ABC transporter permease n=1 Tax=unclassified Methylophilus TaxID=2630143 RepID=UPI00070164F3|nr:MULTISPECIES: ABC transporter permease subunit [unclassified Methylophilus]KQT38060.1 ABC transporter permease [Methylophilus sp. Leaf414]KQT43802.1 ABC transporter permease [Methylophilus sp. Leaf416]KQT59286.1 ABC transporter permease [Methylophilus sp. Leaf459]